jgi:asparagine synthase (glutamine-hydrolysing)
MCGISGKLYFNNQEVNRYQLQKMTDIISHRGPDSTGYYISKRRNIGFGHNRLAIIDLSKNGDQPMVYMNRYVIVSNNEIYNFKEEKLKLEQEGYKFVSTSDTEVILALYARYKKNCVKHLRGMYAFAIYDTHEETLFLARDRIGKKPLKYFFDENCFIFASELKAILTQSEVTKIPDNLAIQKYFLYGYVPAPLTGFKNINKLEPGHYIYIDIKRKIFIKRKYWEPRYKDKLQLSEKEWSEKILETLEESTKLRMISDVPIGTFLSGGVDSSAVVAMMALNSQNKIKTFTVKFKNEKYSEKKYADSIVKRYKTDHTEILAKPTNISLLPEIANAYEEPFADNSSVISFQVSKEAKKHVKVILNGDGGDENFAGYPNRYLRLKRDVDYAYWISKLRPLDALKIHRVSKFLDKSKLPLYERFSSYNQIFSLNEIFRMAQKPLSRTLTTNNLYQYVRRTFQRFNGKDLKDAGLKFDLLYFLPDQLLTKMDIATMYYGLEARSPILDQKMIELACQIPFNLKVKNGETKYIFKKALEKIVPKENLYRTKMGFTIPLDEWFRGDLNKYYKDKLFAKNSKINDFIDLSKINLDTDQKKWSLLMLELWLECYFS